jgi:hypothetical protein
VTFSTKKNYGVLDYSEASIQVVENILAMASTHVPQMQKQAVDGLVEVFGCYVLEVGRRQFGGRYCWDGQSNQPVLVVGEPNFRIAMMTFDRVQSRLRGNPEDHIPFFFEGFAGRVRKAQPGEDSLYV